MLHKTKKIFENEKRGRISVPHCEGLNFNNLKKLLRHKKRGRRKKTG